MKRWNKLSSAIGRKRRIDLNVVCGLWFVHTHWVGHTPCGCLEVTLLCPWPLAPLGVRFRHCWLPWLLLLLRLLLLLLRGPEVVVGLARSERQPTDHGVDENGEAYHCKTKTKLVRQPNIGPLVV